MCGGWEVGGETRTVVPMGPRISARTLSMFMPCVLHARVGDSVCDRRKRLQPVVVDCEKEVAGFDDVLNVGG